MTAFCLSLLNVATLPLIAGDAATRSSFIADKHHLADQRQRNPVIERRDDRLLVGAFLAGVVFVAEDVVRDLNEVTLEFGPVTLVEHRAHLVVSHAETAFHQIVDFTTALASSTESKRVTPCSGVTRERRS